MTVINQITAKELYENREDIDSFLSPKLSLLVSEKTWMKEWRHLAQRFRLFKFKDLTKEEAYSYQWDTEKVSEIILETANEVSEHLYFEELTVTVLPAMPFPWFQKYDQSLWTNGFANGPNNVLIGVPPNSDDQFLRHMIAHELHHATPKNPIYKLTIDSFTLTDWFKMEGGAEFFSLNLYEDKRWWKNDFTQDVKEHYWELVHNKLDKIDDKLCYGDPDNGIPYLTGYAFAYELFKNYVNQNAFNNYEDLLEIEPFELIEVYKKKR